MTIDAVKVVEALRRHKNVLLYGPPGTGKSHLMKKVASLLGSDDGGQTTGSVAVDTDEERNSFSQVSKLSVASRWVTFHQGYSYEDFVIGMRPIAAAGGGFALTPRPGVLLELVAEAKGGTTGLLLIDEINRGNTSRIFGEFITLMEPDKRLGSDGAVTSTTVTITLPYLSPGEVVAVATSKGQVVDIKREFQMPESILTLASMNSVDKSISPMDTALRRRFYIINLAPTSEDIRKAVGLGPSAEPHNHVAELAVSVVDKINQSIGYYLGSDFMLGQWYLPNLVGEEIAARGAFAECWLYRICPQLLELFHGKEDQLIAVLGGSAMINQYGTGIVVREPSDSQRDQGAMAYVEVRTPAPAPDDVMKYLEAFAAAA